MKKNIIATIEFKKFYLGRKFTKNIKIFLQLYKIKTDLLTCHRDLVRRACYYIILT